MTRRSCGTLAAAMLLLAAAATASAQTFELRVSVNGRATSRGTLTLSADGNEACRVAVTGSETDPVQCRAALSKGVQRVSIEWNPASWLRARKQKDYTVVSVADLTTSVRQHSPAVSLRGLAGRLDVLLARLGSEARAAEFGLSLGETVTADALAAAEKRLAFPLDPELKALLTNTGPLAFDDSAMVDANQLDTTERQFTALWGHPEKAAAAALTIYRGSTMVWIEAGDGYGAVIYQPRGPARCGGAPAYWRIHQESIDTPELVTTADGTCGGLRHALFAMFLRDLLDRVADAAAADRLVVDSSATVTEAWLSIDGAGVPALRADWTTLR